MSWQDELHGNITEVVDKYESVRKAEEMSLTLLMDYIKKLEEQVSLLKRENAQLKQDLVNAAMGIFRTASFE